jgi:transposase
MNMPAPLSPDLRARIIAAWQAGGTYERCAARFDVGRATVDRLIRTFRKNQAIAPSPHGGGRPRAIPIPIRHVLEELVEGRPDATLKDLQASLHGALGINVSTTTIGRELHGLGLSLKKKSVTAEERLQSRIQAEREVYKREIAGIDPERLFFLDETGTHIAMTRTHAWSPVGERAPETVPRNRGRVLTLIGALSLDGFEVLVPVEGATTAPVFREFVQFHLAPLLRPGDVVVLDKLGAHRAKGVLELIEACGAKRIFLPSYSPDLNPIEHGWSKVKLILRHRKARTRSNLHAAARKAIQSVTPSDAAGWFKHCGVL